MFISRWSTEASSQVSDKLITTASVSSTSYLCWSILGRIVKWNSYLSTMITELQGVGHDLGWALTLVPLIFSSHMCRGRHPNCIWSHITSKSYSHCLETCLDIQRSDDCKVTKSVNSLTEARRTAYSLRGAGLQGLNGLHFIASLKFGIAMHFPS